MYEVTSETATYLVDITALDSLSEFTVEVEAGDMEQAARRAVRKALKRAKQFNENNPYSPKRLVHEKAYEVVGVRKKVQERAKAPVEPQAENEANMVKIPVQVPNDLPSGRIVIVLAITIGDQGITVSSVPA
ncbi:hypothetical protein [Nocardia tengchongensis]|uniref:hypothetical protein n=1 Tax=Nocardia tengchongensis TaxID=2055889 RepID=UPI003663086A